jgi:hypothetical protein
MPSSSETEWRVARRGISRRKNDDAKATAISAQRQLRLSVMKPPSVGPTIVESPNTAIRSPWYLPRSAGVKMSPMIACAIGIIIPAPTPWTARKAMSWVIDWERPASIEPARNVAMPPRKSHFRPKMSDSLPKMGTPAVEAIR